MIRLFRRRKAAPAGTVRVTLTGADHASPAFEKFRTYLDALNSADPVDLSGLRIRSSAPGRHRGEPKEQHILRGNPDRKFATGGLVVMPDVQWGVLMAGNPRPLRFASKAEAIEHLQYPGDQLVSRTWGDWFTSPKGEWIG